MTLTVRSKVIAVSLLLLALTGFAAVQAGWSVSGLARLVLGAGSVLGLALWTVRAAPRPGFKDAPRLVVVQRVGLSARTALALVEVDGRPFVVVHGDGFARLRPAPRRVPLTKAVSS
jgi:flagellar biogenesis protein FliO